MFALLIPMLTGVWSKFAPWIIGFVAIVSILSGVWYLGRSGAHNADQISALRGELHSKDVRDEVDNTVNKLPDAAAGNQLRSQWERN